MVYEYYRSSVGANACSYANLCQYNNASCAADGMGPGGAMPPVPSGTQAIQVVPAFGTFGYRTACSGRGPDTSCNGYYSINSAYPDYDGCAHFTTNLCSGTAGHHWPDQ